MNRLRNYSVQLNFAAFVAVLILAGGVPTLAAPPSVSSGAEPAVSIKDLRKVAANRQRRILLNNDGGAVTKRLTSPTAKAILDDDTTQLIGSHVDTILYCTKSSGFGLFTHFTKVGHIFTSREDIFANNQMEALLAAKIDPLQVMVDFGKQHGIEIFWSMRMNDTHDGSRTTYAPVVFRANPLKTEHPEYLLGTPKKRPKQGAWSAVDYGRPEIRDLAFRYVEEVCLNYDIDGIELDFSRHPVFFKSTSREELATEEELAMMTDLMRRIRTMADEVGRKRGRPILIAMRTFDSVEYDRAMGLDIEKWLAEDLLDLLVVTSYFQLNEWDYSVKLARKYGVKIYPSLDDARADGVGIKLRSTPLAYRARAAEVWSSGADGVYIYNAPASDLPIWRELGDTQVLAKLDKDYFASVRGAIRASGGNLPFDPYQNIETLNPGKPKPLTPGKAVVSRLNVGEDFTKADPVKLKLRLRFDSPLSEKLIRAKLNGKQILLSPSAPDWLEAVVPNDFVQKGTNRVELTRLPNAADESHSWTDCLLEVRH